MAMRVGDWEATPFQLGERERKAAGADACLARVYTNAGRGLSVSVVLLGGLPGDIAIHTPDVCYPSMGLRPGHARRGGSIIARNATIRERNSRPPLAARGGANPSVLRIFWAWHATTGWAAPEDARWRFASEPTLCKLYVIREAGAAAIDPDLDPCNDFLDVFLPELDRAVFLPAGPVAGGRQRTDSPAALPGAGRP